MTTVSELRARVAEASSPAGAAWLADAERRVADDPDAIAVLFPGVGRRVGRAPLDPQADPNDVHAWTVDDAARVLLVVAAGAARLDLKALYRGGDAAERRAVLRALHVAGDLDAEVAHWLVDDAVRTNDPRLIAAALGPWAIRELSGDELAQAVLKCVFVGIPLGGLAGVEARATPELSRMLAAFAHERVAAGRAVPEDIWPIVAMHPPSTELEQIAAERTHPAPSRAGAAQRALLAYEAATIPTNAE